MATCAPARPSIPQQPSFDAPLTNSDDGSPHSSPSCSSWDGEDSPKTPEPACRSTDSLSKKLLAESDDWLETPDMDSPPPYSPRRLSSHDGQPIAITQSEHSPAQTWAVGDAPHVAARSAMAGQQRRSRYIHTAAARQKSRRRPKHFGRTMRPGISVDTSVSRHRGGLPRQVFPQAGASHHHHHRSTSSGSGNFITLADLKAAQDVGSAAKTSWWPKGIPMKSLGATGSSNGQSKSDISHSAAAPSFRFRTKTMRNKSRPEHSVARAINPDLSPEQSRCHNKQLSLKDISPSDRPITIGISVPSDAAEAHSISPQSANSYVIGRERSLSDVVDTPTIVVTPAQNSSAWSLAPLGSEHRPRAPSSIYSRATARYSAAPYDINAPPVPSLPDNIPGAYPADHEVPSSPQALQRSRGRDSTDTAFEEDDTPKAKNRVLSSATLFEEEDTPRSELSRGGQPGGLSLQTTLSNSRGSEGWWNVITTPFETRGISQFTTLSKDEGNTPSVPAIPEFLAPATPKPTSPYDEPTSWWSPSTAGVSDASPFTASPDGRHMRYTVPKRAASNTVLFPPLAERVLGQPDETSPSNQWPSFDSSGRDLRSPDDQTPPVRSHHSQLGDLSPSDKEILIALGSDEPAGNGALEDVHRRPQFISLHHAGSLSQKTQNPPQQTPVDDEIISPLSRETEFSPVVGLAAVGTVHTARTVDRTLTEVAPSPRETRSATAHPYAPRTSRGSSVDRSTRRSSRTPPPPPPPPAAYIRQPSYVDRANMTRDEPRRGTVTLKPSPARRYSEKQPEVRRRDYDRKWCGLKRRSSEDNPRKRKRRIRCLTCLIILLIIAIILSAVLATQLNRDDDDSSGTPTQWLNLTDFPPMPTGFSTVARPDNPIENSRCIQPSTMWSCALPKENQAAIRPNEPDQPNFKFDIVFDNATYDSISDSGKAKRHLGIRSTGRFVIRNILGIRDSFEDAFKPSPAVPSLADQIFVGNTTDGNAQPFQGEQTPFYISFFNPVQPPTRVVKRATSSASTSTKTLFPNLSTLIPPPDERPDGTAAPANLLPLPSNQPLRLYDRGLPTEHYGFYTYFDRSIFLKSDKVLSGNAENLGDIPSDRTGGATFESATVRCTWAMTRFLVQIWTHADDQLALLPPPPARGSSSTSSAALPASTGGRTSPAASYLVRPGSFPYPVSVTLDRHGGLATEKSLYCYGMDERGRIVESQRQFQLEDRGVGGKLVSGTNGPFGDTPGPIDGGTGGCECEWTNWRKQV